MIKSAINNGRGNEGRIRRQRRDHATLIIFSPPTHTPGLSELNSADPIAVCCTTENIDCTSELYTSYVLFITDSLLFYFILNYPRPSRVVFLSLLPYAAHHPPSFSFSSPSSFLSTFLFSASASAIPSRVSTFAFLFLFFLFLLLSLFYYIGQRGGIYNAALEVQGSER